MEQAQAVSVKLINLDDTKMSTELSTVEEVPMGYSDFVRIAALVVGIPICLLSFAGNLLTITAVVKTKSLQTGANVFIVGLSISDMVYGTLLVPILAYTHWNNGWPFKETFCSVFGFLIFLFVMESINNLVGIAFSRYLKILHPKIFERIFRGDRRTICLLIAFWLIPLLSLTPAIVLGRFGYDSTTLSCTFIRDDNSSFGLMLMSLFLIPLAFITFCYLRILCKVLANHRRIERALSGTSRQTKRTREDYHYTRTMVTIFVVFLMSYTPYMINSLIDADSANLTVCFLCSVPVWMSNCVNPLVYAVGNRQFRLAFWAILTCRKTLFEPGETDESPNRNRICMTTVSSNSNNALTASMVTQLPSSSTQC